MIASITTTLINNVWKASVATEATSVERALMGAYGEPTIDTAGSISYTKPDTTPSSFIIAGGPKLAYVRSGMPIAFELDMTVEPEAKEKVAGWANTIKTRLEAAMTTLKSKPPVSTPSVVHYEM